MAQGNLPACLPVTLAYEGGLSTVRSDPGNWTGGKVGAGTLKGTKFGIAASAHPDLDIVHLTLEQAEGIYETGYWTPAGCEALPVGLDLCHFDATVNSGRGHSAKWLASAMRGTTPVSRVHGYATARLTSMRAFATWATFGRGWSARVAGVEAKAVAMIAGPAAPAVLAKAATHAATKAKAAGVAAHAGTVFASGAGRGRHRAPPRGHDRRRVRGAGRRVERLPRLHLGRPRRDARRARRLASSPSSLRHSHRGPSSARRSVASPTTRKPPP